MKRVCSERVFRRGVGEAESCRQHESGCEDGVQWSGRVCDAPDADGFTCADESLVERNSRLPQQQ